eukprot:scaffold77523_cov39-Attheya_sp.AAC.2
MERLPPLASSTPAGDGESGQRYYDRSKQKKCHPTEEQQIVIDTFAARWPDVSDTAFEQVLSAGGIQLASQTDLIKFDRQKSILEFDDIGESLEPSQTSVTNAVLFTAAHMVIVNAERLAKSKKVYLGCDKGGGVLIKMAFFLDEELGKIVELNLDFDKSGDKAKDGGLATFNTPLKNIPLGATVSGRFLVAVWTLVVDLRVLQ